MVNVFECCRNSKEFLKFLDSYEDKNQEYFNNFRDYIFSIEDVSKITVPDFDLAAKYVYIMTHCFSGIIKSGSNMMIHPCYKSFIKKLRDKKIANKLSKLKVFNLPYDELIYKVDSQDTLLYIDPPYWKTEDLYVFHDFCKKEDHEKLASILNECDSSWILSYYEYDQVYDWYPKDIYRYEFKRYVKRHYRCQKNEKRQLVGREMLIINVDQKTNIDYFF